MKYVIIGNSIAAVAAIEGIRSVDQNGEIVVISEERETVYGRPMISYWLEEKVNDAQMYYRPPSFYSNHNVNVLYGELAVGVAPDSKEVILGSGGKIAYDRLLICSGGKPIKPPIPGLNDQNYSCFYNYQDVRNIKGKVNAGDHVVVLGGGLTGLKTAECLQRIGVKVSIVELADRLLGTILNRTASEMAAEFLRSRGIDLYLETTISNIEPAQDETRAREFNFHLKNGAVLTGKLLIMAIGVTPRMDFLKESGIKSNRGVLVDNTQKTNFPDIFAAGDVAEVPDFLTGKTVVAPILPNAFNQGKIAGINMAGGNESFNGSLAFNAIGFLGLHTVTVGASSLEAAPELEILEETNPSQYSYKRLLLKNNCLIGATFISSIGRAGLYHDLIRSRVDVGSFKDRLLATDFNLLDMPEEIYRAKIVK